MKRLFSARQRLILAFLAGGRCQLCGVKLARGFHADHVIPWSKSGKTITSNGAALCPPCNLKKGNRMSKLRKWQSEGIAKAMACYRAGRKHFVVDAAPGSGKTLFAIHLARELMASGMIERVVVIAPRNEIVRQWAKDFRRVTGHSMMKLTGKESKLLEPEEIEPHIASTWAGLSGIKDALQAICTEYRVLVIADEVHHAALEAAWGVSAEGGMANAKHVIALSGTPIRSDGKETLWLDGEIPTSDYVQVTYGEAVSQGWCVPITFHRHTGEFTVDLDGQSARVTPEGVSLPGEMPKEVAKALERSLRFEKLIKSEMLDEQGEPRLDSYHSTMLDWASKKLEMLRSKPAGEFGKPDAGALVIAPSIDMAEYFAKLIEMKWPGEEVAVVHSDGGNSQKIISDFRKSTAKWIVSVDMISEGVDIHRLRVMVFLPRASTELYFRQAIGRVIRKQGAPEDDNTRAYAVMPELENFIEYASRVEGEMNGKEPGPEPKCPACNDAPQKPRRGHPCTNCGYEPPPVPPGQDWECNEYSDNGCGSLNKERMMSCHACGMLRLPVYATTLQDAQGWREGVITRGEELPEASVERSEEISSDLQSHVIKHGSKRMAWLMRIMPEEMYAEVEEIFSEVRKSQTERAKR